VKKKKKKKESRAAPRRRSSAYAESRAELREERERETV